MLALFYCLESAKKFFLIRSVHIQKAVLTIKWL
jgi:hypothetical protein